MARDESAEHSLKSRRHGLIGWGKKKNQKLGGTLICRALVLRASGYQKVKYFWELALAVYECQQ
jgi:hypothetical protein